MIPFIPQNTQIKTRNVLKLGHQKYRAQGNKMKNLLLPKLGFSSQAVTVVVNYNFFPLFDFCCLQMEGSRPRFVYDSFDFLRINYSRPRVEIFSLLACYSTSVRQRGCRCLQFDGVGVFGGECYDF